MKYLAYIIFLLGSTDLEVLTSLHITVMNMIINFRNSVKKRDKKRDRIIGSPPKDIRLELGLVDIKGRKNGKGLSQDIKISLT